MFKFEWLGNDGEKSNMGGSSSKLIRSKSSLTTLYVFDSCCSCGVKGGDDWIDEEEQDKVREGDDDKRADLLFNEFLKDCMCRLFIAIQSKCLMVTLLP